MTYWKKQESQRVQRQRQRQQQRQKQRRYGNVDIDDTITISQIYKNETYSDAIDAIDMARMDSEEALSVYIEPLSSPPKELLWLALIEF